MSDYPNPGSDPNYGTPPPSEVPPSAPVSELRPLPLGEALRQLPSQYIRVVTRPSAATFAEEKGKAAWNIIWFQIIGLGVIAAILIPLVFNIIWAPGSPYVTNMPPRSLDVMRGAIIPLGLSNIILIPLGYFIATGIYHVIAKLFGGQGTYLEYFYSYLLFSVPLTIISLLLSLIPLLGSIVGFAIGIYQIVLQIFMTMAVHRMSGGRATLAVLILPIIGLVIGCIVFFFALSAIFNAIPHR